MPTPHIIFANREQNYVKDTAILGDDGVYRSAVYGKTLEQYQEEDPAVELMDYSELEALAESRMTTDPVEITKEQFWDRLEVLPPCSWVRNGHDESFYMSEFLCGRVTEHLVRIGDRYFSFSSPVMSSHFDRTAKVFAWLEKQEQQSESTSTV